MPMSGADSLFLNCNEKPLIHFSLPPFIHQALKAQCCLGSGLFLGRGDLQMLQTPCWDSASSHTGQAVTWLAPLSYLSFSLFLYPDVSHDSNPGYLTRSLSWQTDHFPGSLNTIACSYQGPVENRDSLGLGLYYLFTLITESWSESPITTCTASSVLCLAHGSEPPCTPEGLCSCWLDAESSTAYSLDTNCTGLNSVPPKLKSTWNLWTHPYLERGAFAEVIKLRCTGLGWALNPK